MSSCRPGLEQGAWRTCRVSRNGMVYGSWMAHEHVGRGENTATQTNLGNALSEARCSCRCDTCATCLWLVSHMNVESTRRSAGARPRGLRYTVLYTGIKAYFPLSTRRRVWLTCATWRGALSTEPSMEPPYTPATSPLPAGATLGGAPGSGSGTATGSGSAKRKPSSRPSTCTESELPKSS